MGQGYVGNASGTRPSAEGWRRSQFDPKPTFDLIAGSASIALLCSAADGFMMRRKPALQHPLPLREPRISCTLA